MAGGSAGVTKTVADLIILIGFWFSCKSLDADGFFVVSPWSVATSNDYQKHFNAHELSTPFLGAESNPECFIPFLFGEYVTIIMKSSAAAKERNLGAETHKPCVAESYWSDESRLLS